eukprot:SAG31_NODE_1106_length_9878_cov_4.621331_7_plen_88_part_00
MPGLQAKLLNPPPDMIVSQSIPEQSSAYALPTSSEKYYISIAISHIDSSPWLSSFSLSCIGMVVHLLHICVGQVEKHPSQVNLPETM